MKEVQSRSVWVGRVITCERCHRSYEIEVGDEISPGYKSGRGPSRATGFEMPCGHIFPTNNGPTTESTQWVDERLREARKCICDLLDVGEEGLMNKASATSKRAITAALNDQL